MGGWLWGLGKVRSSSLACSIYCEKGRVLIELPFTLPRHFLVLATYFALSPSRRPSSAPSPSPSSFFAPTSHTNRSLPHRVRSPLSVHLPPLPSGGLTLSSRQVPQVPSHSQGRRYDSLDHSSQSVHTSATSDPFRIFVIFSLFSFLARPPSWQQTDRIATTPFMERVSDDCAVAVFSGTGESGREKTDERKQTRRGQETDVGFRQMGEQHERTEETEYNVEATETRMRWSKRGGEDERVMAKNEAVYEMKTCSTQPPLAPKERDK
jgi:hypothetical protein